MGLLAVGCLTVVILCLQQGITAQQNYQGIILAAYGRPSGIYGSGSNIEASIISPVSLEQRPGPAGSQGFRPEASKVLLEIYYATDCPDSMRFITRELHPVYKDLKDIIDLRLVPYGKTQKSLDPKTNRYVFRCQHGEMECYGNAVQSCAISLYPNVKEHLDYISCMESYPRPSRSGQKCARRQSFDWSKIDKCAKSDEGNRLQHEMGEITENLNPRLYFIPWVVVNKVHTTENQRLALRDLRTVVCRAYKGNHPRCGRSF